MRYTTSVINDNPKAYREAVRFASLTPSGEQITIELARVDGNSLLMARWIRERKLPAFLSSWWSVTVYATDQGGTCREKYNPQNETAPVMYFNKPIGTHTVMNFDWVLEATEESKIRIIQEVERLAFKEENTMSCMVINKENADYVTAVVCRMLESHRLEDVPGVDLSVFDSCKASNPGHDGIEVYDPHKLYRMIYIYNLKAYNGRYKENSMEFPKYTGCKKHLTADSAAAVHALTLYQYQLDEYPVYNTPFYWAINAIVREYCYIVATDGLRYF